MSKVHKILRRSDSKGSGKGLSARKGKPPVAEKHDKNLSPEIEAFVADTRRKEKLLKQGIEQLQEHARSLQQKLDETLYALKEREEECRHVRAQALKRENELVEKLEKLSAAQADANQDAKQPDPRGHAEGRDNAGGGSLLSQAKGRK